MRVLSAMKGRILLVDDDKSLCEMLASGLSRRGFATDWTTSPHEALLRVADDPDVVVADARMPRMTGVELCQQLVARRPELPVIVISAFGGTDTALASIASGAYDFITKPFDIDTLALALSRAVQLRALRRELHELRHLVAASPRTAG